MHAKKFVMKRSFYTFVTKSFQENRAVIKTFFGLLNVAFTDN